MSLSYISLCSGASVGITKAAMVHQHDLSIHGAERERRMVTETVRAGTGASTPALPRSRGGGDLFGSMSLSYTPLCSGASVGITKAALVHENNLCSHRMERDRRTREHLWYPLLSLDRLSVSLCKLHPLGRCQCE